MIFEPFEILTLLHAAGVEHVVVGGMAGLLHRSSVLTQDDAVWQIRLKTEAGRPKDKVAVPVLIAALEERNRRG